MNKIMPWENKYIVYMFHKQYISGILLTSEPREYLKYNSARLHMLQRLLLLHTAW